MEESTLLDSGQGRKLERFGPYVIDRPCSQAVWKQQKRKEWKEADAEFDRNERWQGSLPKEWVVQIDGIKFRLQPTDFGHIGIFIEQRPFWRRLAEMSQGSKILNLFAYSGGSTLACAQAGAHVCHVDSSKGMVFWARENAALNNLEKAPIRWIVEDAMKFLQREARRCSFYDGIILDPPSFGRGSKGEVFKIERDICNLLELCKKCLSKKPRFIFFTCHTPGFTSLSLHHLLDDLKLGGSIEYGEMVVEGQKTRSIPSGAYALWRSK